MFNQLKTYIYSRLLVFMERRMRFNKILFAGFAVQFLTLFICAEANYKRCEICAGSGSVLCIRCGGKGRVRREGKDGNVKSKLCLNCSGNGRTLCSSCIGKGWKCMEEKSRKIVEEPAQPATDEGLFSAVSALMAVGGSEKQCAALVWAQVIGLPTF